MKVLPIVALFSAVAVPAHAQQAFDTSGTQGLALGVGISPLPSRRDTPAIARFRREEALVLRREAYQLQAQDGGKLTPEHAAYIRAKAHRILD